MTISELNQEIFDAIRSSTNCNIAIAKDTHLFTELGLSSVEIMMLISDLEDSFGIDIPATDLRQVQTAGDLCRIVLNILRKS